jgi:hypothetical protein
MLRFPAWRFTSDPGNCFASAGTSRSAVTRISPPKVGPSLANGVIQWPSPPLKSCGFGRYWIEGPLYLSKSMSGMYPIGVWYSSQHQAPHVTWKLRISAQNRSILGGYFQEIRPPCNQRLAAPSAETILGGTRKGLEMALPYPPEHTAATTKRRPQG